MERNKTADREITEAPQKTVWRFMWVVAFAIAFAWVEGSVVVYLRDIYFEGQFHFPVVKELVDGKFVPDALTRIEFVREIATILMLLAVGCIAGKNGLQRFCFFMITFATWDIFYYVWLRVMVGWPESLMTWDLLFFVPLPWVGPVISPILIALAMAVAGSLVIYYNEKNLLQHWPWYDWVVELICGLLLVVAFCWDWKNIMRLPGSVPGNGIPNPFPWWLFLPVFVFSVAYFAVRVKQLASSAKG